MSPQERGLTRTETNALQMRARRGGLPMGKLEEFDKAGDYQANQMLKRWLDNDPERAELYEEMARARRTTLRFRSQAFEGEESAGIPTDAYLVTDPLDIEVALQKLSVRPYAALGGGRFMLAMDPGPEHDRQRAYGLSLLGFTQDQVDTCASHAFRRASTLALKSSRFDLASLAEQVAARFVALLYGFPDAAHGVLTLTMQRLYTELCFQILGRHFSGEPLPPRPQPSPGESLREWIIDLLLDRSGRHIGRPPGLGNAECGVPVLARMRADRGGYDDEDLAVIVQGLITGTIGNVQAAVCISISEFFTRLVSGRPLLFEAQRAARAKDDITLGGMVMNALVRNPPAGFLPRQSDGKSLRYRSGAASELIPQGREIVLGMGAAGHRHLVFGGPESCPAFPHQCVGQRVVYRLLVQTVRRVLLLPGLAQVIEPPAARPTALAKRMGMICTSYPLQWDRTRRLIQQPLAVIMNVKSPIAENAAKLGRIIAAGAPAIEEALDRSKHVHFAFFQLLNDGRQLALYTVYDGDFDAYIEHFALRVELFDKLFECIEDAPPTPVRDYPKEFVETIRRYNRAPLGSYFFSAYGTTTVANVRQAFPPVNP